MLTVRALTRLNIGPVDFDVAGGEILTLTGPSGAGKSLLLRAVADLDPNDGTVSLDGQMREQMEAPKWRSQVMYVPAHSGWWADTVEPHFQGANRDDTVAILHRLNLESTALGWQVANLSTGERQRLSLARAIALKPQVLLLDEPTSGLDPDNAARAEEIILELVESGLAVVIVTHDAAQARRLGTRELRLEKGRLTEVRP